MVSMQDEVGTPRGELGGQALHAVCLQNHGRAPVAVLPCRIPHGRLIQTRRRDSSVFHVSNATTNQCRSYLSSTVFVVPCCGPHERSFPIVAEPSIDHGHCQADPAGLGHHDSNHAWSWCCSSTQRGSSNVSSNNSRQSGHQCRQLRVQPARRSSSKHRGAHRGTKNIGRTGRGRSGPCQDVSSDLAEVLEATEGPRVRKILEDNGGLVEVDQTKCTKASRELYSMLARYIGSEAVTIVWSVTGLNGVEAWGTRRAGCSCSLSSRSSLMFRSFFTLCEIRFDSVCV